MNQKHISAFALFVFSAAPLCAQITLNSVASRSVGSQSLNLSNLNPNLVEGRELFSPQGVAVDTSRTPAAIYVADYGNNRVLAWRDVNGFKSGQKADIQIGQPDLVTTFPQGPGQSGGLSTGLLRPTGVAVYRGDLYVVDTGNNRVLRYPSPFAQFDTQQRQYPLPDLFIGQASLNGRNPNYTGQVSAQGIALSTSNALYQASIAFDNDGNLWMTDPGNVRVLRFPAAQLCTSCGAVGPADLEIGQSDFTSLRTPLPNTAASTLKADQFARPSALAFDPSGNLFVTDSNGVVGSALGVIQRVLVFTPPFSTGMSAARFMGVFPANFVPPTGTAALQALIDNVLMGDPEGIFFLSGSTSGVGVVDSISNRILIFDAYANWPTDGTPPQAKAIVGQPNATCPAAQTSNPTAACRTANNGNPRPSAGTLRGPLGVAYTGTDLFVVDSGNNRVLDLPQQGNTFGAATRVLGQDRFDTGDPNLIEGREFQFGTAVGTDAGLVIDSTSGVAHLYVSDPGNNRVLGFKDARKVKPGDKADLVLGQPDMQTSVANYPSGDANKPNANGLFRPIGLAVDGKGNLYVADSLNGRVVRFPAPFASGLSANQPADLVLGKPFFTTGNFPDANNSNLYIPYGLTFTGANGLLVSDQGLNRVLYFPATNGTFNPPADNGKSATVVFGQQSFNSSSAGSGLASMNNPHLMSSDNTGRVYVADTGNNRVLIFSDPHSNTTTPAGQQAAFAIPGLSQPQSVFVNLTTSEIWVADSGAASANLKRYQSYDSLLLGLAPFSTLTDISSNATGSVSVTFSLHPLALVQDSSGDLFVADDGNRVAFYYPGLSVCNGATFMANFNAKYPNLCANDTSAGVIAGRPLAPNVLATVFPCANCAPNQFGDQTNTNSFYNPPFPLHTTLSDIQVMFNGVPTPLYYVGAPIGTGVGQINFVVPNGAPSSGFAAMEVQQASTGQILGAALVQMGPAAPGLLICGGAGSQSQRFACGINATDSSINDATHPVLRGDYIQIYATGQGFVPGAPPDGTGVSGALNAPADIHVVINGVNVDSYPGEGTGHIQYSGLDQFPGVWQINVQIPKGVAVPTGGGPVLFNVISNNTANTDLGLPWKTYIYIK